MKSEKKFLFSKNKKINLKSYKFNLKINTNENNFTSKIINKMENNSYE